MAVRWNNWVHSDLPSNIKVSGGRIGPVQCSYAFYGTRDGILYGMKRRRPYFCGGLDLEENGSAVLDYLIGSRAAPDYHPQVLKHAISVLWTLDASSERLFRLVKAALSRRGN